MTRSLEQLVGVLPAALGAVLVLEDDRALSQVVDRAVKLELRNQSRQNRLPVDQTQLGLGAILDPVAHVPGQCDRPLVQRRSADRLERHRSWRMVRRSGERLADVRRGPNGQGCVQVSRKAQENEKVSSEIRCSAIS